MKRRMSSSVIARIAGAGVVGAVVGVTTLLGAGAASAATISVDKTFAYDCNIPYFGHKTLNIEVQVGIPDSGTVGTPIQATDFTATTPIPHDVYDVFTPFGATQADGYADTTVVVDPAGTPSSPAIHATIPLTQVPNPSGPDMLLPASGPVPAITPTVADSTTVVSLGTNIDAHVTPRDSSGNATILGELTVPCVATVDTTLATVNVS